MITVVKNDIVKLLSLRKLKYKNEKRHFKCHLEIKNKPYQPLRMIN